MEETTNDTQEKQPKRRGRPPKAQPAASAELDTVTCITLRRIGLEDRTSGIGEEVELPRDIAKKLQDVLAIKVKL